LRVGVITNNKNVSAQNEHKKGKTGTLNVTNIRRASLCRTTMLDGKKGRSGRREGVESGIAPIAVQDNRVDKRHKEDIRYGNEEIGGGNLVRTTGVGKRRGVLVRDKPKTTRDPVEG